VIVATLAQALVFSLWRYCAAAAGVRYGGKQGSNFGYDRASLVGNESAAALELADQAGHVGKDQDHGGGKNDHACLTHFHGIDHGDWPCCFLRRAVAVLLTAQMRGLVSY
jgi:hypothetical protein